MKNVLMACVAVVALTGTVLPAGGGQIDLSRIPGLGTKSGSNLTADEASGGLKEALSRGISGAVSSTGRPGGYFNNPAIKITMPARLQRVEQAMRMAGMGTQIDGFEKSMNSAAEEAAPAAKPILMKALQSMTIEDARGIVTGGRTSGTDYFKRTTSTEVGSAFRPIVEKAMSHTGVTEQFSALMGRAPAIPFFKTPSLDINQYVLDKSVDGLFLVMGQEETKIRTNPAAQVTPLLKRVFGGK